MKPNEEALALRDRENQLRGWHKANCGAACIIGRHERQAHLRQLRAQGQPCETCEALELIIDIWRLRG